MAFGDVVQSNTGTSTTATTSPTLGSATTAGNIVVLEFAADDYNGSPNAGWTQSTGMEQQTFHGGYLWWFKCAGSDSIPSYTIGSAVRSTWTLVEYAGPFDASPYDISNGTFLQSSANSLATPSITPTSGSRFLVAGFNAQHSSSDLTTWTGYTNSFTQSTAVQFNGGAPRLSIAQAKLVVTANGSTSYSSSASHGAQVSQSRSALIIAFKAAAGGGVSGTLATTETNDAAAFTGTVADLGTLAATEAADVAAFAGNTVTSGTLAATEGADTAAFAGSFADTGTLATTEAADTAALTGTVADQGSLAATETADAAAFTGTFAVSGTLAVTESQDTAAFASSSNASGTLAATEAADAAALNGTVADQGSLAVTETADAASLTGNAGTSGSLAVTETTDAASFAGAFSDQGTLAAAEAADVASLAGAVSDQGTLAVTEAQDIAAFAGGDINGTLATTEARDNATFTGSVVNPTSLEQGGTYRPWRIKTKNEIEEEELAELAESLREVAKAKPLEIPRAPLPGPIQKPLIQSLPFYEAPRIAAKATERYDDDEEALLLLIG